MSSRRRVLFDCRLKARATVAKIRLMKEHINEEGVYVPRPLTDFPEDPLEHLQQPVVIRQIDVERADYPFYDKSFKAKVWRVACFCIVRWILSFMQKVRYDLKIIGRKKVNKRNPLFKDGALIVCNHVYRWDFVAAMQAANYHYLYFPARAANLAGKDARWIVGIGGIPVPETLSAQRRFNEAFGELHKKKKWFFVFPEMTRWDYYQPLRPFQVGAFKMALRYEVPVIPMVISFRKPSGLRKLLNRTHPLITIHVGDPIPYKVEEGEKRKDVIARMIKEARTQMLKMAGIKQNCWD